MVVRWTSHVAIQLLNARFSMVTGVLDIIRCMRPAVFVFGITKRTGCAENLLCTFTVCSGPRSSDCRRWLCRRLLFFRTASQLFRLRRSEREGRTEMEVL